MKITRGTTPTYNFTLPFSTDEISDLYVTFMQNGEVLVEKALADVTLTSAEDETENSFITDENEGDSIASNNADVEDEDSAESTSYCVCTASLTQEDTLAFTFYPAAEKNIVVVQIRILDVNGEAYASDPIQLRLYGILKDGVIPSEESDG